MSSVSTLALRPARDLRLAGAGLLGAAAIWPALPVHPPFACPLRSLTGVPCPLCGITRACVAALHLNFGTSLTLNPGGVLVVVAALVALVRPQLLSRLRIPVWTAVVTLGALWLWNMGFNPTFHQLFLR